MLKATDTRLRQMAARLNLTYTRDHFEELINKVETAGMTPRESMEYIFSAETAQRDSNRIKQALMNAHFPVMKTLEQFDFTAQPSISPGRIRELRKMEWLEAGVNVAFFWPPGVGKTHLALGFGKLAVEKGHSTRFCNAQVLFSLLEKADKDGVFDSIIKEISRPSLIIIDEMGCQTLTSHTAHLFFQLVSKRHEKKSIMLTSNRAPSEWSLLFADSVAAGAIPDRLLHHSTVMTIRGDSYRLKEHRMNVLEADEGQTPSPGQSLPEIACQTKSEAIKGALGKHRSVCSQGMAVKPVQRGAVLCRF